jgi:hypothetical protein
MRIQDAQQGFRDLRKLVVDFQVNACGKKREGLQQALHMRVFALVRF